MFLKLAVITGLVGAFAILPVTPAQADGIGVMRFLVNNKMAPRAKARPSWLSRRVVKPLRDYRHAKRDVKRLRKNAQMDRVFETAFKKTFNKRFSPQRSTIFGFFAAVAKGNKAGRLAVIGKANSQPARYGLSQRSISYYKRLSPKK